MDRTWNSYITYIHNWPLQPFSQDYDLASHTTHVAWVNFIHKWRDLQFKVDSERQIFLGNFFRAGLVTLRLFAKSLLKENRRRNAFSYFNFDNCPGIWTQAFASNKPTHDILDHGNFNSPYRNSIHWKQQYKPL